MSTNTKLYDQDFYAWTQSTAELVRAGKWYDLDREALAEEVESLGKSENRELEHRLEVLVVHLLQWRYQPEKRARGASWLRTILEQRRRLHRLVSQSPSLRPTLPAILTESYAYIRKRVSLETHLPLTAFPKTCPWQLEEQILNDDFWPEGETMP